MITLSFKVPSSRNWESRKYELKSSVRVYQSSGTGESRHLGSHSLSVANVILGRDDHSVSVGERRRS